MASTEEKKKKAKQPRDHQPATARTWRRAAEEDLLLPSGNTARVRRPGPTKLLTSGIMPDTLMPIVNQAIRSGKGLPPEAEQDLLKSPKQLTEVLEGIDRALVLIVVQPKVAFHRRLKDPADEASGWEDIPEEERNIDEFVYTDEVDMEDKMFLFQYAVGGTRDLERFREESASHVGDLARHASDGSAAE